MCVLLCIVDNPSKVFKIGEDMRPPISTAGQWLALMSFFFVIGVCLILVMNETANPITSTKNISGWVTRVNDKQLFVRIQEIKPEKIRYNAKFGPVNIPPASSVHDLRIKPELAWMKVGDRVSVRVNCLGKDTIFDFSNVCTVEDVSVGQ